MIAHTAHGTRHARAERKCLNDVLEDEVDRALSGLNRLVALACDDLHQPDDVLVLEPLQNLRRQHSESTASAANNHARTLWD